MPPAPVGEATPLVPPQVHTRPDDRVRSASGRRTTSLSEIRAGAHVGSRLPVDAVRDLDLAATIRAAAPRQHGREGDRFAITPHDLRETVRRAQTGTLLVFVVDASGSMGARRRMEVTKGAILTLLTDAYQRRDRVALVSVRGAGAEVILPPTNSVELAHRHLADLRTGGRTPLWAGLDRARALVEQERQRDRDLVSMVAIVSDGRANVGQGSLGPGEAMDTAAAALRAAVRSILVVDAEAGFVRLGLARRLADQFGAHYISLEDHDAGALAAAVRERRLVDH